MRKLLTSFVTVVLLCACNEGKKAPIESGTNDSIAAVVLDEPLDNQEVDQMVELVNAVGACLDSIQLKENMLFKVEESTPKEQILNRLHAFQDLLDRKQAQIGKLLSENKSNKLAMSNLQKMTDYLQTQLKQKSAQIAKLEDAVQNKDAKISELRFSLNSLTAETDYLKDQNVEQDKLLNQVFYIIGTKDELKNLGLLSGGGLSKKRANYANIDQNKFIAADIRNFEKLSIESKSPKLITEKPESSYTLINNEDGTTTLQITDAKAFWTASPYLIIQK